MTSEIIDASELLKNLAAFETAGVDIQVDWANTVGPDELSVNWIATYMTTREGVAFEGAPTDDLAGTIGHRSLEIGVSRPDWKWTINTNYKVGNFGMNARWRYIDSMVDNNVEGFETDDVNYIDLGLTYEFRDISGGSLDGLRGRISVTNVTDQDSEIIPARVQANTDSSTYDTRGLRYFVTLTYDF